MWSRGQGAAEEQAKMRALTARRGWAAPGADGVQIRP